MSISKDDATELVLQHINSTYDNSSDSDSERELVVVDIINYGTDGWIFSYNTKKSVDTGKWIYGIAGNHPIFVFKDNGQMYSIYSDTDEEEIIRRHREKYPAPCQDCCSQSDIAQHPQNQAA
jgi:signal transduction histidine kinase